MAIIKFTGTTASKASTGSIAALTNLTAFAVKVRFSVAESFTITAGNYKYIWSYTDSGGTGSKCYFRIAKSSDGLNYSMSCVVTHTGGSLNIFLGPIAVATWEANTGYLVAYVHYDAATTPKGYIAIINDAGTVLHSGSSSSSITITGTHNILRLVQVASVGRGDYGIDGIAIYSNALAVADRYTIPAVTDANLLGLWYCDEGTGATLNDALGAYNMTLNGTETTDYVWQEGGLWSASIADTGNIFDRVSPTRNGSAVTFDPTDAAQIRSLRIESGEYTTPFMLEFDADTNQRCRIDALPVTLTRKFKSVKVIDVP